MENNIVENNGLKLSPKITIEDMVNAELLLVINTEEFKGKIRETAEKIANELLKQVENKYYDYQSNITLNDGMYGGIRYLNDIPGISIDDGVYKIPTNQPIVKTSVSSMNSSPKKIKIQRSNDE